jgi:two-component system sensor histidine kinase KdpD
MSGLLALVLAYAAQSHGSPITAALIAVFGAVGVGALLGFLAGAIAGVIASLTYNLLLTDPILQFSLSSTDDLVPIVALNVSAIASALIAGRLRDRAVAAETASSQVTQLLQFSEDLQAAVTLVEVETVARAYFRRQKGKVQLFVAEDEQLRAASDWQWGQQIAQKAWSARLAETKSSDQQALLLRSGNRILGVLVIAVEDDTRPDEQLRHFLPLLTLAIQRCQLAEQLADADVVRRSEKFKTALLSSVSHDLRTPLAAISASASSLAGFGEQLDARSKTDLLDTIVDQCGRLDRVTTNLLNLGRIEGGLNVDQMPIVDAIEVLGSTLSRVRRAKRSQVIERNFQLGSALVRADEALLEQVFLNVLENAIVHTPPDTTIKVEASAAGGALLIAIEDDGVGIPKSKRERVFDRFYQVRPAPRLGSGAGSGLGLSIAKGFIELIGGQIVAASARFPMRGARLEVSIPVLAAKA